MMKHEFETIAGYEVSHEDYSNIIEPMYMATEMSKTDFVKCINKKRFEIKPEKKIITVMVSRNPNGTIIDFEAELIDIDIATGKFIVHRISNNRAWAHTSADVKMWQCIEK